MQLKMFMNGDPAAVARQAEEWLTESKANVHHVVQSQSEKQGKFLFVLTIFFE